MKNRVCLSMKIGCVHDCRLIHEMLKKSGINSIHKRMKYNEKRMKNNPRKLIKCVTGSMNEMNKPVIISLWETMTTAT